MSLTFTLSCECCGQEIFNKSFPSSFMKIAGDVGCYNELWETKESGYMKASDIFDKISLAIENLTNKILELRDNYENVSEFMESMVMLRALCKKYPNSKIVVYQ